MQLINSLFGGAMVNLAKATVNQSHPVQSGQLETNFLLRIPLIFPIQKEKTIFDNVYSLCLFLLHIFMNEFILRHMEAATETSSGKQIFYFTGF